MNEALISEALSVNFNIKTITDKVYLLNKKWSAK